MKLKCWICGGTAESAEHQVKRSDLELVFGHISNADPVYRHDGESRNIVVPGADSAKIKYSKTICGHCNNTRTQKHDRAWESLAGAVIRSRIPFSPGQRLPLKSHEKKDPKFCSTALQLYFAKQIGCFAVEHAADLPTVELGLCIKHNIAHPHLYLKFHHHTLPKDRRIITFGDLRTVKFGRNTVSAIFFYTLNSMAVMVHYCEAPNLRLDQKGWHPEKNPSDPIVLRL
jgi:hypothetical protein